MKYGVRLHPKKFEVFTRRAMIGGALFKEGGSFPNPDSYQAVIDEPTPDTLEHVYNGMCSTGWSRPYIPNYAILEHPVRVFVMKTLGTGKKTKQRVKRFKLANCGWTPALQAAYDRLRLALIHSIKRAHRDPDKVACVIWDASKYAWTYTVTQVYPDELSKPWTM